jgi:hypothetical protein
LQIRASEPRDDNASVFSLRAMDHRLAISTGTSLQILDDALLPQIGQNARSSQYVFDLSNLSLITAPDAVNLLLLLGYVENVSQKKPILVLPNSPSVVSFLSNVRFFVLAESRCKLVKTKPLPDPVTNAVMAERNILVIKYMSHQEDLESFYDLLIEPLVHSVLNKLNLLLSADSNMNLSSVFTELCKNVFEHSGSFGYVAAQKISSVLQITIGDLGIGIFETLKAYYLSNVEAFDRRHGPVWNEAKALDIAFVPGVSAKRKLNTTGEPNNTGGGAGLNSVLETVKESKGRLICRTGTNKIFLGYRRNQWTTLAKHDLLFFPGTQLEVFIPLGRTARHE